MIDSLLTFYCGSKNSKKKKKVLKILDSIRQDESTKEYICKSTREPDKEYIVFYSKTKQENFCTCRASLYKQYKTFETVKERNLKYKKYACVHIIAVKIWKALKENENQ